MPVKRDGRRSLAKVSGATSVPSPTVKQNIGICNCSTATAHTRVAGSRDASQVLFDALAAALFVGLIVALIVVVCGGLMLAAP